jgi:hypothetical protein
MTETTHRHSSRAGASFTKALRTRCAVMRPVVIAKWNKTTGLGLEA